MPRRLVPLNWHCPSSLAFQGPSQPSQPRCQGMNLGPFCMQSMYSTYLLRGGLFLWLKGELYIFVPEAMKLPFSKPDQLSLSGQRPQLSPRSFPALLPLNPFNGTFCRQSYVLHSLGHGSRDSLPASTYGHLIYATRN